MATMVATLPRRRVIRLPRLHRKQLAIKRSRAKRKVMALGRRWGKTTLVSEVGAETGMNGRRFLYATPTAEQLGAFWSNITDWLAEPIRLKYVRKNETEHTLEWPHGGHVRAKTAHNADTLRGDYCDVLALDEFPYMDADAWDKVGSPMLLDNDGDAWFIGTPNRKNHFYAHYVRALGDGVRWQAWNGPSMENPHLSKAALDEIAGDLTEDAYRQEILAEFLDNEGAVFRNIAACMGAPAKARVKDHEAHRLVIGADWGKLGDFTALSVVCSDCRQELARERFNRIDYEFQRKRLITLALLWGVDAIIPESNSMGEPIIDGLRADDALVALGIRIVPFATTAASKPPLIQSLALALEREECQWQDDPIWTGELGAYEVKYSAITGRPSYSAPEGVHDDTVMARALAWHGVSRPTQTRSAPGLYD